MTARRNNHFRAAHKQIFLQIGCRQQWIDAVRFTVQIIITRQPPWQTHDQT